jgi:hypothetical protein
MAVVMKKRQHAVEDENDLPKFKRLNRLDNRSLFSGGVSALRLRCDRNPEDWSSDWVGVGALSNIILSRPIS